MISKSITALIAPTLLLFGVGITSEQYKCGEKKMVDRPYGKVQLRVNCDLDTTEMWVSEYRGDEPHGISIAFDRETGRRLDSCFFRNGKQEGQRLAWDSTGFIKYRETYRNGSPYGKKVSFFGPNRPATLSNYDSKGRKHGLQQEWWPNGNKKFEVTFKNGEPLSGTEYYQNGRPRIRFVMPFQPKRDWISQHTISYESWAPDGRAAGVVKNGQGEIVRFLDTVTTLPSEGFHEVYRDSLQDKVEDWDAATVAKWLENYGKTRRDSTAPVPRKTK